tara:strand:- start:39635 stop:40666 length:1032 start_codon:yes stop_codon:yes gene_type:complete
LLLKEDRDGEGVILVSKYFKIFIGVLIAVFCIMIVNDELRPPEKKVSVTIELGVQDSVNSALAIIAKQRGLFAKHGLRANFKVFESDESSLKALIDNEVQVAFSSTIPFVIESFEHDDLRLLAGTGFTDKAHVVLVKKADERSMPSDLEGQIVGTVNDSAVSIFLRIFIKIHNIPNVKVEYYDEDELVAKFEKGEVDAIAIRAEKYEEMARETEQDLDVFTPDFFRLYGILASKKESVTQKKEALQRFVKALVEAEKFIYRNPVRSKKVIFEYFGVGRKESIAKEWESYRYIISLGESLLLALESAQRLYKEEAKEEKSVRFLPLIDTEILRKEKPYGVTIRQ